MDNQARPAARGNDEELPVLFVDHTFEGDEVCVLYGGCYGVTLEPLVKKTERRASLSRRRTSILYLVQMFAEAFEHAIALALNHFAREFSQCEMHDVVVMQVLGR